MEAYRQERQQRARDRSKNEGTLKRELGELTRTIERWIDGIGDGSLEAKVIGPKLNTASARKDEIEALMRAMPADDVATMHPSAAEHYRRVVATLHDAVKLDHQASREAVSIVRGMIEAIEIKPGPDRMELTVTGDLASFLHREQDGNLSTTSVVAGTRSHLYRTTVFLRKRQGQPREGFTDLHRGGTEKRV